MNTKQSMPTRRAVVAYRSQNMLLVVRGRVCAERNPLLRNDNIIRGSIQNEYLLLIRTSQNSFKSSVSPAHL
jgi:hypothetical protein